MTIPAKNKITAKIKYGRVSLHESSKP